jgi:uncharacterized protein
MDFTDADRDFLLKTACMSIQRRLEGNTSPKQVIPPSPAVMRSAGCFVSLHSRGNHALRGCIGRIDSSCPLLEVLLTIAWQTPADPRFSRQPVMLSELPSLQIEISVLGHLMPKASPLDFESGKDGLYLTAMGRSGVFLPQVATETGWTREQLLDRLCQEKMGLPPQTWREPAARLFTFPSVTLGPVDFVLEAADPIKT